MMRRFGAYQIEDLGDHIFWIREDTSLHMYLIIGNEKAALIDTGLGVGDLKGCLSSITDKPVIVCATHYHLDHVGGAGNFDEIYISSKDAPKLKDGMRMEARKAFLSNIAETGADVSGFLEHLVPEKDIACHEINPGDKIDLGGRTLEIVDMTGHTPGSIGYFDNLTGTLFAGDGCNNSTFLFLEDSSDAGAYKQTLINLKKTLGSRLKRLVIFHDYTFVPLNCIDNVIDCCDNILNGTAEDDEFYTPVEKNTGAYVKWVKKGGPHRVDGKFGNIAYDTRHLK